MRREEGKGEGERRGKGRGGEGRESEEVCNRLCGRVNTTLDNI